MAGFDRHQGLRRHRAHDVALSPPQHRTKDVAGEVRRVGKRGEILTF
jgi:hypothetical protein